jgi:hypothetical protein
MRLCLALLASLSLVACGGGDDADRPDAPPRPDARIDAEPSPDCLLAAEYGLSLGTPAEPAEFGGSFGQDDAGNWVVAVYGGLEGLEPELGNHGLTIFMVDNIGIFLDTPFGNVPLETPVTINGLAEGDECGACLEGYAGQPTSMPPNSTNNIPTQIYLADAGEISFTEFTEVVDDTNPATTTDMFFEYTGVAMTGYNFTTGEPLDPACLSSVDISVALRVNFDSTPGVAPGGKPTPRVADQPFVVTRR